ncbi:MAG: hydroxyphenylacetyl-CoA thioesterase PaaI [Betaproteobacteria bacterium]|nr:hydroxyphenylacetyl-CoA thioesterase PaaI [Betaproteobacteria bacterium]
MSNATEHEQALQLAARVRKAMLQDDYATAHMGIDITDIGPGCATATMTVQRWMLNGHATCHGGFIATLADSAFAFACNAYNEITVASGFDLSIVAPAREGDVLSAVCSEQNKTARTGVYDVEVRNQAQQRIALFRGRSYTMKGKPVVA